MKTIFKLTSLLLITFFLINCSSKNKKDNSSANNIKMEIPDDEKGSSNNPNYPKTNSNNSNLKVEDLAGDDEFIERPKFVLEESIDNILASKNKFRDNVNSDGSIYVVVSESTVRPSNQSGFILSRNAAFAKALLKAKMKILSVQGQVLTTERESEFISNLKDGTDPDLSKRATFLEKIGKLANQSVDKALLELGMDQNEILAMNQKQKEKAFQDNYSEYASSCVYSMLRGISVVKVAEGERGNNDYEIAICVKYSPEDQELASRQNDLGANKEVQNSEIIKKIKSLSPEKLISMMGAKYYTDENGNRFAIGFGQRPIRKTNRRQSTFEDKALDQAVLDAKANLSNLLGETIEATEISEYIEKETEFQDGQYSLYTEDNYSRLIDAKKKTIRMSSITIHRWRGTHPVSNSTIMGAVVLLTEKNSVNFKTNNYQDKSKIKGKTKNKDKTSKSKIYQSEEDDGSDF